MTQKIYFLFVIIKESACIQHGTVVDSTALYGSLEKWLVFCTVITWLCPGPAPTRLRTWTNVMEMWPSHDQNWQTQKEQNLEGNPFAMCKIYQFCYVTHGFMTVVRSGSLAGALAHLGTTL